MTLSPRDRRIATTLLLALAAMPHLGANGSEIVDQSMRRFLEKSDALPAYRAMRRLEAENGARHGWLEAMTEYSPETGFRYQVTGEGGSGYIRNKVLRAVLDGEVEVIAQGESARSALAQENYIFQPNGLNSDGLLEVLLSPRRKERVLIDGTMFLHADQGDLVRLQGRLAKSPSFWVKDVDITRAYQRLGGVVVPISLESRAQVRMFGPATMKMTYDYVEVEGQPVAASTSARAQ